MHLVCVDMPGHEGTTRTSAVDYSIEGQVKRIHQVGIFRKRKEKNIYIYIININNHMFIIMFI